VFGSTTLDLLIGIILIFFLLSVACSAMVESIAAWSGWRAKNLKQGLSQLLGDAPDEAQIQQFLKHPLVRPSTSTTPPKSAKPDASQTPLVHPPQLFVSAGFRRRHD